MAETNGRPLRAVGYCRTSGEGQRDNTSIPRQKEDIEAFCKYNKWELLRFYVDECKTGSNTTGRGAFLEMMKHATDGQFDVVVPYDATRFARDGVDILSSAKFLKNTYDIVIVDAKAQFDNRTHLTVLQNFVHAGVSQWERVTILERTIRGRMRKAAQGLPWTGRTAWPVGRAWDKEKKQWHVTDQGRQIAAMLKRYLDGAGTTELGKQMGVRAAKICAWIRDGQLGGEYKARFYCPEIDIDTEVTVPGVPEIVPAELIEQAKARLVFNRTNNRTDVQKYYLTGFLRCGVCGKSLTGRDPHHAKRTYYHASGGPCGFHTVPGEAIEARLFNLLYRGFLDQPAFEEAVKRAMPSIEDRRALEDEAAAVRKQLREKQLEIKCLVDAVSKGADLELLLETQDKLKGDRHALAQRLAELEDKVRSLPTQEQTDLAIRAAREMLEQEQHGKDWRKLPFDQVRRFLLHLFGETTRGNGYGIFVRKDDKGRFQLSLKGRIFQQDKPVTADLSARNRQLRVTLSVCSSQPATKA